MLDNYSMDIEDIYRTRREALKLIVDEFDSTASFCRKYNLDENRVRHLLRGVKNFGEKAAREMERICDLPDFYFDVKVESKNIMLVELFSKLNERDQEEIRRHIELLNRDKAKQ